MRNQTFILIALMVTWLSCQSDRTQDLNLEKLPDIVDFNFHIKPILSDRCFSCHGPDKNALKGDLRLDLAEGGIEKHLTSGGRAFVGGSSKRSEALQRILSDDPEWQMPPPDFNRRLSPYERALLEKWIKQGAVYKSHWAFIPPEKPDLPKVSDPEWCRNEIDFFILKKLDELQMSPNESADRTLLIRRATFDLTGLPPTLEEIDEFIQDRDPGAFEKVIDRLLASEHYGERMARPWLDLARYADSNGYSQDGLRIMWPWREWVIDAFNDNLPYDDFLKWQLAGDYITPVSQEQQLATGFLRNHRQNAEGGIVDEEYRIEYAADRTETAATVFLGLTMQCARCHDHKYDPISQEEYYRFFSFFNNINERGITASDGNSGPELVIKSPEEEHDLDSLQQVIDQLVGQSEKIKSQKNVHQLATPRIDLDEHCLVSLSFEQKRNEKFSDNLRSSKEYSVSGKVDLQQGETGNAIKFTAFDWVNIKDEAIKFDRADPFSMSFDFKFETYDPYISILNHLGSKADNFPGYEIALYDGYPMLRLVHSLPAVVIQVQGVEKIPANSWTHLTFTYDGSGEAKGIKLFVNGIPAETEIVFDNLTQGISNSEQSLTVGGRIPYNDSNKGYGFIDELRIYDRQLTCLEAKTLYDQDSEENDSNRTDLVEHNLIRNDEEYNKVTQKLQKVRTRKFDIEDTLVSVMIMEELREARPTYMLDRGVYDAPGKRVYPGVPEALSQSVDSTVSDRMALTEWLLDENHPLTARVAVNRMWQLIFGRGLVKTTEDFGNQGALPSHPELLDWLAIEFRESGWDTKGLLKLMLSSATYQQSSRISPENREQDPENIFLARGPSHRLSAEQIRDCALAASGLLAKDIGGPSVKPYQPPGLWKEKGEFTELKSYVQDTGTDLYRRSLYTFWRRTSPPPTMATFDAPTRDLCTPSRLPTNTPLQALVLLNDPQFVEASRVLAERVIDPLTDRKDQIAKAHRLLTGLPPNPQTLDLLLDLYDRELIRFRDDPEQAKNLLSVGESSVDSTIDPRELAATTLVCSTIMSFDETLVKR